MSRPINRSRPALPCRAMQTYRVASPIQTHTRPATCAEVQCPPHVHGWDTVVDESSPLGQMQAAYVRANCLHVLAPAQPGDDRRRYTEHRDELGMTVFHFAPGQRCFPTEAEPDGHRVPLDRPEIYTVQAGDWRGGLGLLRRHTRPDLWVEDFAEHQQALADRIEKG
jgi:hypothetical protein